MRSRSYYEALLPNPNVQRGLAVIRAAEGTDKYNDPYAVTFGGRKFDYSRGHPGTKFPFRTKSGKRKFTTAHGAYQFLQSTWNGVAGQLGLQDMSPRNQDIAALALIDGRRGLEPLVAGDLRSFVHAVGPEWASLPTAPKDYDQPTRGWRFVEQAWNEAPVGDAAPMLADKSNRLSVADVAPGQIPLPVPRPGVAYAAEPDAGVLPQQTLNRMGQGGTLPVPVPRPLPDAQFDKRSNPLPRAPKPSMREPVYPRAPIPVASVPVPMRAS